MLALASLGQAAYANDSSLGIGSRTSIKADLGERGIFGAFSTRKMDQNDQNESKDNEKNNDNQNNQNDQNDQNDHGLKQALKDNNSDTIRGLAKVTAINNGVISAVATIGKNQKSFTITTDANTSFTTRTGGLTLLSNIQVGDVIGFSGTLASQSDHTYSLNASKVKEWGDVDLSAKVSATGTISKIDASSSEFTIVGADGKVILVNTTDLTKFKNASSSASFFASLSTGMTVKVKGFWNSLKNIITAIKVKVM